MKEGGGNPHQIRSAAEKERTKLRERQRRLITTKIFHGLRKHGGYQLSPRADINEVLRHLAHEAGWVVEPDGTTYRSSSSISSTSINVCPHCGAARKSCTPTPTSGFIGAMTGGSGGSGTPSRVTTVGDSVSGSATSLYNSIGVLFGSSSTAATTTTTPEDPPLAAMNMGYGGSDTVVSGGPHHISSTAAATAANLHQIQIQPSSSYLYLEARASNQNTPAGPQRRI